MSGSDEKDGLKGKPEDLSMMDQAGKRRALLKKLGRFAAVTAPTVTLLLAAQTKPSSASPSPCKVQSSRTIKTVEGEVNPARVLAGVAALSVAAWHYKAETGLEQRTHIGPYAEDFEAAFGVGDGVTISTIDAIGVCLSAIKGLTARIEALEHQLASARITRQ